MDKKKTLFVEWIITILLAGIILMLVIPLLVGAGYTYPAADDFIIENGSITWMKLLGSTWKGPFYGAWRYFVDWQGAYTSDLLLFTIMPYYRFGLTGFHVIMIIISLFFVCALYFMVHAVISFSQITEEKAERHSIYNKKLFLYAVLLFAAFGLPGTWIGKELFYWYTAALGYLVGISCLFIAIGCFLLANYYPKNKRYYIVSMLFGFAASGVSPQVASFVCSWLLLALLSVILSAEPGKKPICFWDMYPFLVSFCGAAVNVAAPGSIRRSQATKGENVYYGVMDAIKDTFTCQKREFGEIWHDPFFITLVVVLFLACIYFEVRVTKKGQRITWIHMLLMCSGVLISNFLCIFPVILGYHGGTLSNDRTKYVAEFEIRFSLLFAIVYLAQYVSQILSEKEKRNRNFYNISALCGILISMGGFIFLNKHSEELMSGYSFELIKEFSNGTIQEVFSLRKEVLDTLEAAQEGTDVYIEMPSIPSTRVTYSQGIGDDPESQVNQDVAALFHVNTVVVKYGTR